MIDIIGAISLTALFGVLCTTLIRAMRVDALRSRFAGIAFAWFAAIVVLGGLGVFSASGAGTPAIGLAVLTPIVLSLFAVRQSSAARAAALTMPLAVLVGIHAGRLLGVFFLLLFDAGRLPPTFAMTAGWGDIGVAAAALPLAWAIHHRVTAWRALTFGWNVLGFVDLVTAITLGVGSAPGSPVRFIFESPNSGAVASLPWVIIPAVLVPLYLVTHLAIFAQLARGMAEKHQTRNGGQIAWESSAR